jgi:hypothetical protein
MNVYIDIDGCILHVPPAGCPAPQTPRVGGQYFCDGYWRFFRRVTAKDMNPYWLSAWSATGRRAAIDKRISPNIPKSHRIRLGKWKNDKTEFIKNDGPWIWFDDDYDPDILCGETKWLAEAKASVVQFVPDLTGPYGYRREFIADCPGSNGLLVVLPGTFVNLLLAVDALNWHLERTK